MAEVTISLLVEGGKASGGVPLGPQLGPMGINTQQVVDEINNETKEFAGITIPVKVFVDKGKKTFRIEVGTPSVASLIKKEIGIEKGAKAEAGQKPGPAGDITIDQITKIAKIKQKGMIIKDLKAAVLSVLGTSLSVGVTCDGKSPKEIIKAIKKGEYDKKLKG